MSERKNKRSTGRSDAAWDLPLPRSEELEAALLGALMGDPDRVAWSKTWPLLEYGAETFYAEKHRHIYRAMEEVAEGQPAMGIPGSDLDIASVTDALTRARVLDQVGRLYLGQIALQGIAAQAEYYARGLTNYAVRRRAMSQLYELAAEASSGAPDLESYLADAVARLERLRPGDQTKRRSVAQLVDDYYERIQSGETGPPPGTISTGLPQLDARIGGGLRPQNLIVVGALSGMGKSALCLQFARVASTAGHHVYYATTEMGDSDVVNRAMAQAARLPVDEVGAPPEFWSDGQWDRLANAMASVKRSCLHIDDDPHVTIAKILARARRLKAMEGLDLLVVDYIQRIKPDDSPATANMGKEGQVALSAQMLQQFARDMKIPVVAAAQVIEDVKTQRRAPTAGDTRHSRAIGQEAHVFLGLHRPNYFGPEPTTSSRGGRRGAQNQEPIDPSLAQVHVGQKRDCKPGIVSLHWDGPSVSFAQREDRYEERGGRNVWSPSVVDGGVI